MMTLCVLGYAQSLRVQGGANEAPKGDVYYELTSDDNINLTINTTDKTKIISVLDEIDKKYPNKTIITNVPVGIKFSILSTLGFAENVEKSPKTYLLQRNKLTNKKSYIVCALPGTGKTTLCNKLKEKGINCVDNDDISTEINIELQNNKEYLEAVNTSNNALINFMRNNLYSKKVREFLSVDGNVIVMITYNNNILDCNVIIMKEDPQKMYRRTLLRMINNVSDNRDKLTVIINETENTYDVIGKIYNLTNIHAIQNWDIFINEYNNYYSNIPTGSIVLSPDEVYEKLLNEIKHSS